MTKTTKRDFVAVLKVVSPELLNRELLSRKLVN
jgi:hypothetical protein